LTSLADKVEPKTTSLLVVDVQNDFCHSDGALAQRGSDPTAAQEMIRNLLLLVDAARGAGATIVWIRMVRNEYTISEAEREQRVRTRPGTTALVCLEGSWGGEFYRVEPEAGEVIVSKHRYSGFVNTDLDLILRSRGIKTVVLSGVASNVCVESTARDAYMRDYMVVFVDDCSAAYDQALHAGTLRNISEQFGQVVQSAEIFDAWQRRPVAAK